MSRGYDAHQQRQLELSLFGKELTRRSKSKCELSAASGVPLHIYEIPPVPHQPDISRCLMLCENVIDQLNRPARIHHEQWRHLGELIWSDIPAVQIMSYRILQKIAEQQLWAQDIIDNAYLEDETLTLATQASL